MTVKPTKDLETFPNPRPENDYSIHIRIPEFTCLCPKTGQPDFATIHIEYVADQLCVELKSLKLYMWSFRDTGAFHEAVTNEILDDLRAGKMVVLVDDEKRENEGDLVCAASSATPEIINFMIREGRGEQSRPDVCDFLSGPARPGFARSIPASASLPRGGGPIGSP